MVAFCLFVLWIIAKFDIAGLKLPIVAFHILSPKDGFVLLFLPGAFQRIILPAVMIAAVFTFLGAKFKRRWVMLVMGSIIMFLAFLLWIILKAWDVPVNRAIFANKTMFYHDNYINPASLKIDFPKKRNLIVIVMESMNVDFEHIKDVDNKSVIPNLIKLREDDRSFSFSEYEPISGFDTSIAFMFGAFCGVPMHWHLCDFSSRYHDMRSVLKNATCVGDILHDAGYVNVFMNSTTVKFTNKDKFLFSHGFGKMIGMANSEIIEWDDGTMFDRAKIEVASAENAAYPYMLVIQTVHPHGEYQPLPMKCKGMSGSSLNDVIKCMDGLVSEFVTWSMEKYPGTGIIIIADHNLVSGYFTKQINEKMSNRLMNIFINLPRPKNLNRKFTAADIMPTIIEAVGGRIAGKRRLGLGVSLYNQSDETLLEKMPRDKLEFEMHRRSDVYESLLNL